MNELLYRNQTRLSNGQYQSTFLFAHDDTFWREQTLDEIHEMLHDESAGGWQYKIKVISTTKENKVNCFVLFVIADAPIEHDDNGDLPWVLQQFADIQYYDITPIEWFDATNKEEPK